uniref:Uncharacterized protein n=1 Tax=Eutreptiella gymnastica TaxID=73025 RepID=A0A7S4FP47_9EUGL|mmetsp:Transcript_49242/g.82617  ORF Transcript_49242/g.82617 Transcript_49242/m.82617 type:complete len:120 (+) Transcript_49242:299-658(+)
MVAVSIILLDQGLSCCAYACLAGLHFLVYESWCGSLLFLVLFFWHIFSAAFVFHAPFEVFQCWVFHDIAYFVVREHDKIDLVMSMMIGMQVWVTSVYLGPYTQYSGVDGLLQLSYSLLH